MEFVKDQRIYVKFCFKLRETAAETHKMCQVYSDDALSQMTYEWYKRFKN
jgi:hypothetical protein